MKTFNFAILVGLMLTTSAFAKAIECKTPYAEKTFTISDDHLAMKTENNIGRSISSVISAQTKVTFSGFVKTMYIEQHKYKITIADKNQFSELNDYLVVTSPKGHKVTYPLNCN